MVDGEETAAAGTDQWIGCDGTTATTSYALGGDWTRLSFAFGIESHAPDGLTGTVTMSSADDILAEFSATKGRGTRRAGDRRHGSGHPHRRRHDR